ncbi:hypothetical protein SUGI_1055380 [Cryptomeria japonica]|uniref:uncharacterized protein LOC131060801 n=1 Tax=Cryptomeria japonica TaxID=3369 RepID=UPI002414A5BF|nr:uncharacterized protein LOC131060801 [Cryptomeria japonica]XP_057850196.1 uncharacterized protein LOC131060801 [Cryptomeria japonica]GLJ49728.1 hypothetical protein SUGI_1055380 [Cryptomeria japonica]
MDLEGGPALASARASGSHPAPVLPTAKRKMFAPHIPHNKDNKRQRMRGAQHRHSPAGKPNHNFQNDDINQSNHNSWNDNCNDDKPTNPNESHENAPNTEKSTRKRSKHWNHHISTNSKESHEVISSSERAADKRSYTWHRKQTVQDTIEEDNAVAEGQIHSNLDAFSRPRDVNLNRMNFKGPSEIFHSHIQDQEIRSQRDSCYKLWNKLDAAYDARERLIHRKEEELAKREQAVRTQEEIVAHWKAQAQAERLEAAYMRQEAYAERLRLEEEAKRLENLKADIEQIRDGIVIKQTSNDLDNDIPKYHGAQSFHVKKELPEIDDHNHENKVDESLEATGDPSQCCAGASQVKLGIFTKAHEHPTQTLELCEVSVSEVRRVNVSEKRHFSHQQCHPGFSEEIVNTTFESSDVCVADMAVMKDSDPLLSEPNTVDVCQDRHGILTSVGDKESTQKLSSQSNANSKLNLVPAFHSLLDAETLTCKETKVHLNNAECLTATPKISAIPVKVKIEDEISPSFIPIKDCKTELFEDFNNDELDHVSLEERKKLCKEAHFDSDIDMKWLRADSSEAGECESGEAWKEKARNFTLKRNYRKTKTCSVETALEEDAPGLLQVLREKGVMEEIKLYGDFIDKDLLSLADEEDNFKDLESIIEKLWGRPSGLFKVVRTRQTANKPTYCLPCLLSLIEQTRSLQNRKWPVEWGWCRQLQSFVFVFERHNRIVLERPEYGYATYFFELVQLLPIQWQVGRLITVMSIATCSRTALLTNKPLEIGHDLNAEEASILEDYGWTPNSGLASLLNYCDRVVHDRKDDDDMEWRSKIGKLLMDGHAGGRITKANIPKKLKSVIPIVKLEECQ